MPEMTQRVWVIVEVTWEYNDEYSYSSDGDSGRPALAFTTEAAAKEACMRKNVAAMRSDDNLCNYNGNDGWEALAGSEEDAQGKLRKFCDSIGCETGDNSLSVPPKVTYENCVKLYGMISLCFYSVEEIAIDQPIKATPASELIEAVPEPPKPAPEPPPEPEPKHKKNILLED